MKSILLFLIFLLILLIFLIGVVGCRETTDDVGYRKTGTRINGVDISVYVIDGCEYIGQIQKYRTVWATHKGNCNNPIHQTKQ